MFIVSIRWYMAERTRIDRSHNVLVFYNGSMILCSTYICMTASFSLWQTVVSVNKRVCDKPTHFYLRMRMANYLLFVMLLNTQDFLNMEAICFIPCINVT